MGMHQFTLLQLEKEHLRPQKLVKSFEKVLTLLLFFANILQRRMFLELKVHRGCQRLKVRFRELEEWVDCARLETQAKL